MNDRHASKIGNLSTTFRSTAISRPPTISFIEGNITGFISTHTLGLGEAMVISAGSESLDWSAGGSVKGVGRGWCWDRLGGS